MREIQIPIESQLAKAVRVIDLLCLTRVSTVGGAKSIHTTVYCLCIYTAIMMFILL